MHEQDRIRTPLLNDAGVRMLRRLREHPHAPRWNYAVGDRLVADDLPRISAFQECLANERSSRSATAPPEAIARRAAALRSLVPAFAERVPQTRDLAARWFTIPTTCRRDLAEAPWTFVPDDVDLERLVIYRTAGTTGHPIEVPHHPWSIACYQPMVDYALAVHGVRLDVHAGTVGCFLIGSQVKTYTYSTVLSAWHGAGFAKVNLRATEWPSEDSAHRYFEDMAPPLITGEPVAFSELARSSIPARPKAMLSTSVAMSRSLRAHLSTAFQCPVIDWYSLVETGPIAYSCPRGNGMHVLPHDIHVEVVDERGLPLPAGEWGEVVVSGGRNPYLPLLRYRTGDHACMALEPCPCGDPMPRLMELEGRRPILFRAHDDTPVGSVDLSRKLREFTLLLHTFEQHADRSCTLVVRPRPEHPAPRREDLEQALRELMGELRFDVSLDPKLGDDGKVIPYRSAFSPEL
jgi:phenylacetate-CoA ligase